MVKKKVFIIFGGYGSVGSVLSNSLAERGYDLLLCGRDTHKLALVADSIGARYFSADCTHFKEVQDCVEAVKDHFGQIDGVAHCIGSLCLKPAHLTIEREWFETINTNLTSAFACLKYSVGAMKENGGSIVLASSVAANTGMPNHEALSAAKAGIIGLTLSAAATYSRFKIRVNAVSPGFTESNLSVVDIAAAMEYLLTDSSTWMTGQILGVDGGFSTIKT